MSKRKFKTEQIIKILKEHESGIKVSDISRKCGVCDQTLYNWKQKFGGMEVNDAIRLKELEEENRKLKRLVADQALDIVALKEINSNNW